MDFLATSDLDPCLSHDTSVAGLEEIAELEAEVQDAAFDSESGVAELHRFQHREAVPSQTKVRSQNISVELPRSTLQCPRSVFEGREGRSVSISKERVAVQSLLKADPTQEDGDFVEFELDNFSCYINSDRCPFELRALHTHATLTGKTIFYLDGVLRVGDVQHHVRRVPFEQIPLGNYGESHPAVGDQLWIRSKLNEKKEIYYQLKNPSREYARFHGAFLWVADLAKHVVDFSEYMIDQQDSNISLHHFKEKFGQWLRKTHGKEEAFQAWYTQRGGHDFRQSIVANQAFIRKEAFGTLDHEKWRRLLVFHEIAKPFDLYKRQVRTADQEQDQSLVRSGPPDTIVTPYIRDCFSNMNLGQLLKAVEPCMSTEERTKLSWPETHASPYTQCVGTFVDRDAMIKSIKPGDLISTHHDPDDCNNWKAPRPVGIPEKETTSGEGDARRWYCLVQEVYTHKNGSRTFDILWMYQPEDTPCGSMRYPYKNELFLSDHCTCHADEPMIREKEVTGVHAVEWHGSPDSTSAEFFVRQTYQHLQRRFITLEQAHLRCRIGEKQPQEYHAGDTVLVLTPGTKVLEPYELLGYPEGGGTVRLRRLLRRGQIDRHQRGSAPNELVYTEEETYAPIDGIHSKCIIRCYSPGEEIPVPYNLNGTGNAFFITHRKLRDGSLRPLGPDRPQLRQGFDPKRRGNKLRALDLYCGCGNLGRGLEEGGAVEARWANDIWDAAVHTYMANARDPRSVTPFLGSVDDLLHFGLEGNFSGAVPRPGEVDLISGGSPCPGFSLITADKTTMEQKKNRSLVASFAAYVDFYRPKYGVLENVTSIVQRQGSQEDFLSQLFCAIVGMGYQAQIILGDSWAHGSPQRRERAFLLFAAPGLRLPSAPRPSHSHPARMALKGLGRMTNGEPFMRRGDPPTPFGHTTPLEATSDLPDIYDAKPDTCVPFPDHRLSVSVSSGSMKSRAAAGEGKSVRTQILNIPTRPYGMNFAKAWYGGAEGAEAGRGGGGTGGTGGTGGIPRDMFDHERDAFPTRAGCHRTSRASQGWGRAHPGGLLGTVTTFCHVTDARVGHWTHWDQPRPLTIMEARRAQGIPDGEVLLGTPKDQWKLVGNAVARQMATALGLALREAWAGTLFEEDEGGAGGCGAPVVTAAGEVMDGYGGGHACGGGLGPSRSQTPGSRVYSDNEAASASASASARAGGTSSTPATSLPDADDDDPVAVAVAAVGGAADGRKRSLSRALADELLASKRLRLTPRVPDEGSGPEAGPQAGPGQSLSSGSGDDDDDDDDAGDGGDVPFLGSASAARRPPPRRNGPTVVSLDDDPVPDAAQHQAAGGGHELTVLGPPPLAGTSRRGGPTIVRLLSDDEDEDVFGREMA